jgi:hypothetical protein
MGPALKSLALSLLCLALAGPARAAGEDRMIFVDLPKGVGFQPEVGVLLVSDCNCENGAPSAAPSSDPVSFDLEIAGHSNLKNGKSRYVLGVPSAQRDRLGNLLAAKRTSSGDAVSETVGYAPAVKLCRKTAQATRFVTIEWGVTDAAGNIFDGKTAKARIKVDRTTPLCTS